MQDRVIEAIEQATLEVFALMVGVDVTKEGEVPAPTPSGVNIVSSFTLTGAISGTANVYYAIPLAEWFASRMLQAEGDLPREDVLDAAGEVANMIVGTVKNTLEAMLGAIQIGTPTVAICDNQPDEKAEHEDMSVTFRCRDNVFNVCIGFQESRALVQ